MYISCTFDVEFCSFLHSYIHFVSNIVYQFFVTEAGYLSMF